MRKAPSLYSSFCCSSCFLPLSLSNFLFFLAFFFLLFAFSLAISFSLFAFLFPSIFSLPLYFPFSKIFISIINKYYRVTPRPTLQRGGVRSLPFVFLQLAAICFLYYSSLFHARIFIPCIFSSLSLSFCFSTPCSFLAILCSFSLTPFLSLFYHAFCFLSFSLHLVIPFSSTH